MKRKLLAVICSVVMAMTMCVGVAWADPATYTITINNEESGHTYSAYQIFRGDYKAATTEAENKGTLSNVEWGNAVTDANRATVIDAAREAFGATLADDASAKDVAKAMEGKTAAQLDTFAKAIASNLTAVAGTSTGQTDNSKYEITNLPAGYYLVKDEVTASGTDANKSESKFIVQVLGNDVNIDPKADKPTVEKKVKDKNQVTGKEIGWQDSAAYSIGDEIPFQLTGYVPTNINDYDNYTYTFTDTMSAGLTFNNDVKVRIVDGDGAEKLLTRDTDYKVTTGTDVAPGTFKVEVLNLKNQVKGMTLAGEGNSKIVRVVVEYSATLSDAAVIGSNGNPNEVTLTYSNEPNGTGTGTTEKDKVTVFTFQLTVNKVDGDNSNAPLAGAGFTLYKKVPGTAAVNSTEVAADQVNGKDYKYVVVAELANTDGSMTQFAFNGLDAGDYMIRESKTPAGYNTIKDITFTVTATHDSVSADPKLTDLQVTASDDTAITVEKQEIENSDPVVYTFTGIATTTIANFKGSVLPSTGGIGTTIFYVVGACLVVIAGVALVAKRRAAARRK